ncbi:hypothetical protein [Arenimonas daejeonensis]|nr:hypothetical protein [Arenimonas daejeonensis]
MRLTTLAAALAVALTGLSPDVAVAAEASSHKSPSSRPRWPP